MTSTYLFHPRVSKLFVYTKYFCYINKPKHITQICKINKKVECDQELYDKCLNLKIYKIERHG